MPLPRAGDALGAIFDHETQATQLEDSRAVLRDSEFENFRQWHPGPVSLNQTAQQRGGLALSIHQPNTRASNFPVFWRAEVNIRFQIGTSGLIFERIRIIFQ
jgi:hypothetical protein